MKKKLVKMMAGCLLAGGLFASCREDRSGEYYALISTQTWMYEVMQEHYLFYEDLPKEEKLNFFNKPHDLLKQLASQKDQKNGVVFSHIDSVKTVEKSRAENVYPTFGFECALVRVPNGAEAMRVLYTQKDSPAEEVKLKRGDWIIAVNGKRINQNNFISIVTQPQSAYSFTMGAFNGEGFDTLNVVKMPAPRMVKNRDVLEVHPISMGGKTAYYILYNAFGSDVKQLTDLFAQLGGKAFDDIILDLRYNPGGYVTTSQVLGSNLAPVEAMNKPFIKMKFNDKKDTLAVYNFDPKLVSNKAPMGYRNLYVITSQHTASASEAIINGLRPFMKGRIFQVGDNTFGKNLGQQLFRDERALQMDFWLTTFSLSNAEDFGDYFSEGLKPDFLLKENVQGALGALGTKQDSLMLPVLEHIASGKFPAVEADSEQPESKAAFKVLEHSIAQKPKWFLLNN